MNITRIPLEKRLEALVNGPSVEVMRAKAILRRLAALKLHSTFQGDELETVLEPVRDLGVTAESTLAEFATAVSWADELLREEPGAALDLHNPPLFPCLREAVFALATRFGRPAAAPKSEIDRLRAQLKAPKARAVKVRKVPLAQRIEDAQSDPELIISQIGGIRLRHFLDAALALAGDDPDLVEGIELLEARVPDNLKAAIADVSRHVAKIGVGNASGDLLRAYFIVPLASMCGNAPDFASSFALSGGIQRLHDQRQGWQKIDELLKSEGY